MPRPLRSRLFSLELTVAAAFVVPAAAAAQVGAIGLSAYRAQRFENENLLIYTPASNDAFASALAVGDFNGDGADDLATGIPNDDGVLDLEIPDCGMVVVRYGTRGGGLRTPAATTVLSQLGESARDPADEGDHFGHALAACDFNHDGFDDLAVGIPDEDHGSTDAGAVQIHYGSAAGLPADGDAFYAQSTPGIPGDAEAGDHFGFALACGDFNGDGFADLAIGVPFETREGTVQHVEVNWHGMVDIVPGGAQGLNPPAAYSLHQDTDGMDGGIDDFDLFGYSLAAGRFDGGIYDDLAIGIPDEGFDDWNNGIPVGAVQVVFGGPSGADGANNIMFSGNAFGGTQDEARFGNVLATGDLDGNGKDDLAIGVPRFDINSGGLKEDAGEVAVVYGAGGIGLDLDRAEIWTQDAILGSANDEAFDKFGTAIAIGDFDGDGIEDLAVGHPGEVPSFTPSGAATVMMGAVGGLSPARHRTIVPGEQSFPGDGESGQQFGRSLASGDFDGDGHDDLAIGVPLHDLGDAVNAGEEIVLYGSIHTDGFEHGFDPMWLAFASPPSQTATTSTRFAGTSGLVTAIDPLDPAYVRHDMPTGIKSYRARFLARLWPMAITPNRYIVLLRGDLEGVSQFSLYVNRGFKENGLTVGVVDNSGSEVFAPLLIPAADGWRAIEVNWRAATPGASNGIFDLWIDGHFYPLLSGLANSQSAITSIRLGAVDPLAAETSGSFFLDEYAATRFTRVGELASFIESPLGSPLWPAYQALFNAEITTGCAARSFCPTLPVTREQMAVFLLRSKEGPTLALPACTSQPFGDVPVSSPFCPWIRELANRGVVTGCGGGNYCPANPVTRQQAAVMLQRTLEGATGQPLSCTDDPYPDVSRDSEYCPFIKYLRDEGISQGCGGGRFCPLGPVTRAQLPPFLVGTFDLFVPEL